jgi:transposase
MEAISGKTAAEGSIAAGEAMREPEDVAAMLRLKGLGWGVRRIARELGCSPTTVRRYVAAGGWLAYRSPDRPRALAGHESWVAERFRRHRGNAYVVRQDLGRELGISVSLRTVERAVAPLRRELAAEARATVRFETPPGKQLQIDFGELRMPVEGESGRVFLFVATLGYSRRLFVRAFHHQRQSAWFEGLEGAFRHFGGVPEEVLIDNARALVTHHDVATREVTFNRRFHAFAAYWGFRPRACAPLRARTKGKDERGVGYVKRNAVAGHRFASWAAMEAHLARWSREIADARVHGTTGEVPQLRFERAEAAALRPLEGRPPFRQIRELVRVVQSDGCIELDTNRYSVPWRLIGAGVTVQVAAGTVTVRHGGAQVAHHPQRHGRRERAVLADHLVGIVGATPRPAMPGPSMPGEVVPPAMPPPALLRSLAEYEQAAGGAW